jgi:hypothetical protein|tara:strand:- start:754 stop:915 length:162 start_codon:yes stop_codon:yes gene_type:complete
MPKVVTKDGKTKNFSYSKKGMAGAKAYASSTGGKIKNTPKGDMKRKYGKAKKY